MCAVEDNPDHFLKRQALRQPSASASRRKSSTDNVSARRVRVISNRFNPSATKRSSYPSSRSELTRVFLRWAKDAFTSARNATSYCRLSLTRSFVRSSTAADATSGLGRKHWAETRNDLVISAAYCAMTESTP